MKTILSTFTFLFFAVSAISQNTWSGEVVKSYMDNCVGEASKAFDKNTATEYCSCTMRKLEIKYPDATKLNQLQQAEINELAQICLNEVSGKTDNTKTNKTGATNNAPQPPRPSGSTTSSVKENKTGATTWSTITYDAFMTSCVDAAKTSMGEVEAKEYCSCTAGKLQVSYPDENTLTSIPTEEITKVAQECLGN